MCLSVTEFFKRWGRGVALATQSRVAAQGLLVYIYTRELCVCVCASVTELFNWHGNSLATKHVRKSLRRAKRCKRKQTSTEGAK